MKRTTLVDNAHLVLLLLCWFLHFCFIIPSHWILDSYPHPQPTMCCPHFYTPLSRRECYAGSQNRERVLAAWWSFPTLQLYVNASVLAKVNVLWTRCGLQVAPLQVASAFSVALREPATQYQRPTDLERTTYAGFEQKGEETKSVEGNSERNTTFTSPFAVCIARCSGLFRSFTDASWKS